MVNFFNLNNYKDRTYLLILGAVILSFVSIQSLLVPSLDYFTLKAKSSTSTFYNYATIASLAATIPQISSIVISYIINDLPYRHLIKIIISIVLCLSGAALFIQHNFVFYATWVIICGVLFNALIFGLDRQVYALLSSKIKDFQSDITLFLALGSIIGYRGSYLLFTHFGVTGIIICFILLNILIYCGLRLIPAIDITTSDVTPSSTTLKFNIIAKSIFSHKELMIFLAIMLAIIFCGSGLVLMFTSIIRNNHFESVLFANIMSVISICSFIGALACRSGIIQRIDGSFLLCGSVGVFACCLISLGLIHSVWVLLVVAGVLGFANAFLLINMNIKLAQYVIASKELIAISPLINGFMTTCFYIMSLLGPLLFNHLLQNGINYRHILISCGALEIPLMILLFSFIKTRSLI